MMNRRRKNLAQISRLETALKKLEDAKQLLWLGGEPMMSTQVSALALRTDLEVQRARSNLGLALELQLPIVSRTDL